MTSMPPDASRSIRSIEPVMTTGGEPSAGCSASSKSSSSWSAFYFFSDENRGTFEPPHVHVRSGNGEAVFWLSPVSLREAGGYNPREIERVRRIVVGSRGMMLRRWHEFFDRVP